MTLTATPTPATLRRFALFVLAGAVNTGFGLGVYSALVALGQRPTGAVVVSTAAGVVFNFHSYGAVFAQRALARLPQFAGLYAALTLANIALLRAGRALGLGPYGAEALAVAALAPVSFLLMRRFVFAPAPEPLP